MAENELTYIEQEIYPHQEKFLELTKKIFFIDSNEDIDFSTLSSSLFGVLSQMSSINLVSGIYHRNFLFDEHFLNTASLSSSIYNFAKQYSYEILNATPASCKFIISIRELDVLSNSKVNPTTGSLEMKINKRSVIRIEDFEYILPSSVLITSTKLNGNVGTESWNQSAKYITEDYNMKGFSFTNPYIKTWKTVINAETWFLLEVETYNLSRIEIDYDVIETDGSVPITYNIPFKNQLAGFKVEQAKLNTNVYEEIVHKEFNATSSPANVDEYYYYTYPSESELEISFGSVPDYRPKYGSSIRITAFTTAGSEANFSYTGNCNIEFRMADEDILQGYIDISKLDVIVKNKADSAGGKNSLTIKEIKQEIINKLLVRNNLATEFDLNQFFASVITKSSVNGGTISFIKKRDDILKRIFSSYLLLRDIKKNVIPTNTFDLLIDYGIAEENQFRFRTGSIALYDELEGMFRLLDKSEYPEDFIANPRKFVYALPYLLYIRLDPFPRIIYYRNSINETKFLEYKSTPPFPWETIINSLTIERNSSHDSAYKFTTTVSSNIDEFSSSTPDKLRSDYVKMRLIFRTHPKDITKEGSVKFCLDMQCIDKEKGTWSALLFTDDLLNTDGELIVYPENNSTKLKSASGEVINSAYLPENVEIEVMMMYDVLAVASKTQSSEIALATDSIQSEALFRGMIDLDYTDETGRPHLWGVTNYLQVEGKESLNLFKNLSEVIYSDLAVNDDAKFLLRNIPFVGAAYYFDYNNGKELTRILTIYEDMLKDNIKSLQGNTQVDLKFYNTYGVSELYTIDSTNLFLKFTIILSSSYTKELDSKIRSTITEIIELSNDSGHISVSNIVAKLENTYKEIKSVEIFGINDYGTQTITYRPEKTFEDMSSSEVVKFIPEYLNIALQKDSYGKTVQAIDITYK